VTLPIAHVSGIFGPLELLPMLIAAGLYAKRSTTLAAKGRPVPLWRQACFASGLLLIVAALVTPLSDYAEELVIAHMAEHLLIGDVAALLIVLGLTGPLLAPVLRVRAIDRLRVLTHPVIAFVLWAANLYLWHLSWSYQLALRHDLVHVLQHVLFLLAGINLWMPLFGPFPKPAWFGNAAQLAYIVAVRMTGAVLANVFLWSGTVFYAWYGDLEDQSLAGAVMMVEESVTTIALFGWLFMKWMREGEERQELLELAAQRGIDLDERRVARAVAAGRGAELRRRLT
jgi:cytochrome c oxidase assembly factor CtaG